MRFAIVGAGFSGAVLAQELAKSNHKITIFDTRKHIGGNCYTERDKQTGILIHTYGPHIFHTDNRVVWDYINQFAKFNSYVNRVKTTYSGEVYSLPINLHTINQFFRKSLNPSQAEELISSLAKKDINIPISFEEQAMKFVGKDLYEAFLKGYTIKQWGIHPKKLPASILKRLPIRFSYNDNYFNHKYQGIPEEGYTPIVEKLLNHENIEIKLSEEFHLIDSKKYDHVFYSGAIDALFKYKHGALKYRTLDFSQEIHNGDYQGCAVMNYSDNNIPYTRITEHKHFSANENHKKTIIFKEYSRECKQDDIPYYPIRLIDDKSLLLKYVEEAKKLLNISFIGRLGTYRYLDMDVTIQESLDAAQITLDAINKKEKIPTFFINME
ncbi:UDP-galactopyranose mutase [Photorhabdus luminescens]|nr:UDP-galactopyranose mutase [Photorhabdus luminescens]